MQSCNLAGFEGGVRGLQAKECGTPLEAGKGKEIDCTRGAPERNNPVDTFILVQ